MTVEFEGYQLFAAGPFGEDGRDHLRLILIDRVEGWLRAYARAVQDDASRHLIGRITDCCALVPIALDESTAVAWHASSIRDAERPEWIRVEKTVRYTGNDLLFGLSPRAPLVGAPRAFVTPNAIRFSATAPWDDFASVQDAIEQSEHRVRQFLCWQHLDVADVNRELPDIAAERLASARNGVRYESVSDSAMNGRRFVAASGHA